MSEYSKQLEITDATTFISRSVKSAAHRMSSTEAEYEYNISWFIYAIIVALRDCEVLLNSEWSTTVLRRHETFHDLSVHWARTSSGRLVSRLLHCCVIAKFVSQAMYKKRKMSFNFPVQTCNANSLSNLS